MAEYQPPQQIGESDTQQRPNQHISSQPELIAKLGKLFTGDHLNASAGEQYSDKNFGRDSAISILFLLNSQHYSDNLDSDREIQHVAEQSLKSLVRWQGKKDAMLGQNGRKNAEEPGKIHHEAGPITVDQLVLVNAWQDAEDAGSETLVYFGSVDSSPLFVQAVSKFVAELWDTDPSGHKAYSFLLDKIPNFRGDNLSVVESSLAAANWILDRIQSSSSGFLEYFRLPGQEHGIRNQVWKDSLTSYIHLNGDLANTEQPIASIEVQALAYDALLDIADMFDIDPILQRHAGVDADDIDFWRQQAFKLRGIFFESFWLRDQQRFVQAVDRDPDDHDNMRTIDTPSSNELHLLNSRIFDDLPEDVKKPYIESLVQQAISGDFLTDLGLRCRAAGMHSLINFADYHGSWAVWPWETHWIANGLRHQGLQELADELDTRLFNAFKLAGSYREFFLADPVTNTCYYRFMPLEVAQREYTKVQPVVATNIPDEPQTWSFATFWDIEAILSRDRHQDEPESKTGWLLNLEAEILKHIKRTKLLTDDEVGQMRIATQVAGVDRVAGRAADARYYQVADRLKDPN